MFCGGLFLHDRSAHNLYKTSLCAGGIIVFVLSLRASTLKIAAAVTALAIVVAAACWEGSSVRMSADVPVQGSVVKTAVQNIDASTNDGRLAFLKNYGWEVSGTPVEVVEVIIPKTFNAVYTNYNAIQKSRLWAAMCQVLRLTASCRGFQ
jgi:hypothetical protein